MEKKELTDKELEAKVIKEAMENFYRNKGLNTEQQAVHGNAPSPVSMPNSTYNVDNFQEKYSRETDPDLMMSYELVKLPSKGVFYPNQVDEVKIEYLTSRDEDLMTTPSFIEDNSMIDRLLERKIVDKSIKPRDLLSGDRSAILLFLRASSYGHNYKVMVTDPRTGNQFEDTVDLRKLKYKEVKELPDSNREFSVELPMRKKLVKFKLLTSGEEQLIMKNAEAKRQAYGEEVLEYNTLRLKASIVEIGGKRDRSYIDRFVDVMPALDAYTIRMKILDVSPDVDMSYEFKAKDGYKFTSPLTMGIDFFFPSR